jgi:hypothetical protein
MGPVVTLVAIFTLYFVIGPFLCLVAIRIALWLARMFELPDALGRFGADTRRSFLAHTRMLDRELGPSVGQHAD